MIIQDVIKDICQNSDDTVLRKSQLVMFEMIKAVDTICKKHNINYWLDAGTLLGAVRHQGFIPWDDDVDICMPRKDYIKFLSIVEKELPEEFVVETDTVNLHKKLHWCRILYTKNFVWYSTFVNKKCMGLSVDVFPMDLVRENTPGKVLPKVLNRICSWDKPSEINGIKDRLKLLFTSLNFNRIWENYVNRLNKREPGTHYCYGVETSFLSTRYLFHKDEIFPLKKLKFEGYEFNVPNNYDRYLYKMYGDYMKLPPESERMVHATDMELLSSK